MPETISYFNGNHHDDDRCSEIAHIGMASMRIGDYPRLSRAITSALIEARQALLS